MSDPYTRSEILSEIAALEALRRGWPGLDAEQDEEAERQLMDLNDALNDLDEAEHASRNETAVSLPAAA